MKFGKLLLDVGRSEVLVFFGKIVQGMIEFLGNGIAYLLCNITAGIGCDHELNREDRNALW